MDRAPDDYTARRRKEDLAFMVVRFLKAYVLFEGIYEGFREHLSSPSGFEYAGLFARIKTLEETLIFDIKEKAHFLFRSTGPGEGAADPLAASYGEIDRIFLLRQGDLPDKSEARRVFSKLRRSLVAKSLDSYIGTGFHMFMILRESFYQLEFYVPQYLRELEYLDRIEYLTQRMGYQLDEEEEHELQHIKQVVRLCQSIASDTRELAAIAIERCRSLFRESAEIIRHSIEEGSDNEVLVLNLLREESVVETVYGSGASEEIFQHMFRHFDAPGKSGREKAREFARRSCGNIESLR
jgi:hypothetical protein